jgi:hypothetical protein
LGGLSFLSRLLLLAVAMPVLLLLLLLTDEGGIKDGVGERRHGCDDRYDRRINRQPPHSTTRCIRSLLFLRAHCARSSITRTNDFVTTTPNNC